MGAGVPSPRPRARQRVPHDRQYHRARSPERGERKRGASDQALGRSRGGLTTKIHLLADSLGRPLAFALTPGQAADIRSAEVLLSGHCARYVLADRAYDARSFREAIAQAGAEPVIPPNPTRKRPASYDRLRYRDRNRIERLVGRLKRFRRIATRYDRRAAYFLASIHIVACLEWMT
jgi:transposase